MYTENLVNLFGGNNEVTPKKKNNTTIIIIVVVVVCCVLLLCAAFMMNNQKKQKHTNKQEDKKEDKKEDKQQDKKEDKCAGYNDNSEDYSLECMEQVWKDTGCTTAFKDTMKSKMDETKSKGQKLPPLGMLKKAYNMMIKMGTEGKEMCFGVDKSKWPVSKCDVYKEDSTNVSDECITELYSAGCPSFDIKNLPKEDKDKTKQFPYGMLQMAAVLLPMEGNEKARTLCYGSDKSKWPPVCSHYADDAQMVSKECVQDMFTKAGCTKEMPKELEDSMLKMKDIKDEINKMATSTDPAIKSKCN